VVVGLLLLGYGIYTRKVLGAYVDKVERLEQVKAEQAQRLRQKTIALKEKEVEVERKEAALRLTKGQLRISRKEAERKTAQMYRVRGKLGDRSKRLKRIEKIAKVKKKK
jgi:multidrug efflux pump subunit AcrA (membrane-fusion protein)